MRQIIHIDADCFFAALEMRDAPALTHVPMAVGGCPSQRGVISTCNYPARAFGVHSAMSSAQALRLCPTLKLVPHRMAVYRQASLQMRQIFADYTPLIEPVSGDEAYLDVSEHVQRQSAVDIAEEIRQRIYQRLGITVSAGIAPNKFLAKVASDWHKPNGLMDIKAEYVDAFVAALDVGRVAGLGKVTTARLRRVDINTCGDLQALTKGELAILFGRFGERVFDLCRGVDHSPVRISRRRKSLSTEHTYAADIESAERCLQKLPELMADLHARLLVMDTSYRIVKAFIKVKFSNFTHTTVERSAATPTLDVFQQLCLEALDRQSLPVRLLGMGVRFSDVQLMASPDPATEQALTGQLGAGAQLGLWI